MLATFHSLKEATGITAGLGGAPSGVEVGMAKLLQRSKVGGSPGEPHYRRIQRAVCVYHIHIRTRLRALEIKVRLI